MNAFAPVRTVAPAAPILSLADAKAHLKVDTDDEDDLITAYAAAAEGWLDGYHGQLGAALVTQTWQQTFDAFPDGDRFRLPLGPLQQVDEVAYVDEAGSSATFTGFRSASDAIGPLVLLNDGESWPATANRPDAVTVTWTCGFGDEASDVPAAIVQAAKLLVGHWRMNREAVSELDLAEVPMAVRALIAPYRAIST